jgi:hypothetical protein
VVKKAEAPIKVEQEKAADDAMMMFTSSEDDSVDSDDVDKLD